MKLKWSDLDIVWKGNPERAYTKKDQKLLNGHYEYYYDNGALRTKGTWVNGMKEGAWQYFNKNGTIDTWYVDANNNGTGDSIYIDDDEDGYIEQIDMDLNENGSIEIMLFDTDLDGHPNEKLIDREDQNAAPKWDAVAVDIDQDGTWDKVQDIPKS